MSRPDEIRLWRDDDLVDRAAPPGWQQVTTAFAAIERLGTGRVIELSLDHDLGDDQLRVLSRAVAPLNSTAPFERLATWRVFSAAPPGRSQNAPAE